MGRVPLAVAARRIIALCSSRPTHAWPRTASPTTALHDRTSPSTPLAVPGRPAPCGSAAVEEDGAMKKVPARREEVQHFEFNSSTFRDPYLHMS